MAPYHRIKHKYSLNRKRGAVLVVVILFLPVLLLMLTILANAGFLFLARHRMSIAADMAALAGLHALDLDKLAQGTRYIRPEEGMAAASEWAWHNLDSLFEEADPERFEVLVSVMNPTGGPDSMEDPSVSVEIRYRARLVWPIPTRLEANLSAEAEAAVKPRR